MFDCRRVVSTPPRTWSWRLDDGARRAQKASKGVARCWQSVLCHGFLVSGFEYADVQTYFEWWSPRGEHFLEMGWNLGVVVTWHHNPKLHWDDLHASRCRRRESKGQRQGLQLLQNLFGVVVSDGCWWQVASGIFFKLLLDQVPSKSPFLEARRYWEVLCSQMFSDALKRIGV